MGWSRGAAWALQIAMDNADLIDGVGCFAGYPSSRDISIQQGEARTVMQLNIPVVVCQFIWDSMCSPLQYPYWYAQFELACNTAPGTQLGLRRPWFIFLNITGDHNDATIYLVFSFRVDCGMTCSQVYKFSFNFT